MPNWKALNDVPVSKALASIPDISTFNSAVSGGLNPAVNITSVLDNGPYVIFAPTNDAFAALEPGQLDALKGDPAALAKLDYYHVFLGLLGPEDVHGQRPTQQGAEIKVTGKNGDIKVNDTAKVVCGGIQAENARIYIIDKVLDSASPPEPLAPSLSSSSSTTTTPTPRCRTRKWCREPKRLPDSPARDGYLAFQTGWRFSANANGPSLASSDRITAPISRIVLVQPGSSPVITPSSTPMATRLLAHTASGALTVIRSASAIAASTTVPSGTTSLIRPHLSASAD